MSPDDSGLYQLLLHLAQPVRLTVGRLGTFDLAAGWYVYTGSARRGRAHRLARHKRRDKPLRWHIDYLTAVARVVEVRLWPTEAGECAVNQRLLAEPGVSAPLPGFGSSDCRAGCPAHLAYLGLDRRAWPPNDGAQTPAGPGANRS